jgi:hypothetical protein
MMRRSLTTGLLLLVAPAIVTAQDWNAPSTRALVERATARREAQLADTGLRNYKAEARGYLTFLAQMGEGFREPPKIVRTDQIASDVYWRAPDVSRQFIKGRRDTLLLPTDINYHRDHLGIVQNNFPNIIRLGDGDEVEDVPHPLSRAGLAVYDYAIRDSLEIRLGPRVLELYEVRVRPKDDRAPRAIGSVYIDRESADVVRMTLSFTRSALKDKALEDVSIVLENGLIDGRFWLPRHQEIEIRRTGTWLDYPVRGIIRGRWEISDYDVNTTINPRFLMAVGPEIAVAPGSRVTPRGMVTNPSFQFEGGILDSLPPDVRAASDADVRKVQEEARALVRGQALARSRTLALSGRRLSDFVHVNRVEGLALGGGLVQRLGGGVSLSGGASYGFSDEDWKARGALSYTRPSGAGISVMGYRGFHDVSDVVERSGLINTFAAQEFGSDYTDPYFVRGAALSLTTSTMRAVRGSLEIAYERQDSLAIHATPANGAYDRTIGFPAFRESRVTVGVDIPTHAIVGGFTMEATFRASGVRGKTTMPATPTWGSWLRGSFVAQFDRAFGNQSLVLQTVAAGVTRGDTVPAQHLVYFGGPRSAPGYDFHSLVGTAGVSQRVEWQFKVPFVAIPLGAWGNAPASLTLAPYANAAWVNGAGWRPSVGLGMLTLFDLVRFDVARGLRDGRWWFGIDVSRDFWSVL